jgi:hypothetical protein
MLASNTYHLKVKVLDKPGPCTITLESDYMLAVAMSHTWKDEEPGPKTFITTVAKKASIKIEQPPRVKLYTNDVLFLEEFAYITIESKCFIKSLKIQAHFGPFNTHDEEVANRLHNKLDASKKPAGLLAGLMKKPIKLDDI